MIQQTKKQGLKKFTQSRSETSSDDNKGSESEATQKKKVRTGNQVNNQASIVYKDEIIDMNYQKISEGAIQNMSPKMNIN